jgi:hypothetical protein
LLEQNFGAGEFEQGRYDGLAKEDGEDERAGAAAGVQRGLAEIEMLDRQLRAAGRRQSAEHSSSAAASRQSTPGRQGQRQEEPGLSLADVPFLDHGDGEGDGEGEGSAPSTGRSSVGSSRYGGGRTFMTRLKSDVYLGDESRQTSARSQLEDGGGGGGGGGGAARFTPRGKAGTLPSEQGSPAPMDLAASLLQGEEADAERALAGLQRPPPRPEMQGRGQGQGQSPPKNYLEENRHAVGRCRIDPAVQVCVCVCCVCVCCVCCVCVCVCV